MKPSFDWDQWNSQKSFLKHGITNREAESAYMDPNLRINYDLKHSVEEDRYICIGKSEFNRLLMLVVTMRSSKVRIISSRLANKKERDLYGN
jgi:uncharacterized DUF497 family protein